MSISEISTKIWSSQITCQIEYNAANNNINDSDNNDGINKNSKFLFLLIPRNSYMYFHLPEIFDFFQIPESKLSLCWFEDELNNVLKWNVPLDICYGQSNQLKIQTFKLKLNLNYSNDLNVKVFQQNVSKFDQISIFLEKSWRNSFKESCYLINGSSNSIMSMSMQNTIDFWNSIKMNDFKTFEKFFKRILVTNLKNVPIKLYLNNNFFQPSLIQNYRTETLTIHQTTLLDLIEIQIMKEDFKTINISSVIAIAHGIKLPLDVPIDELYKLMKHIDGFLHIYVHFT